MAVTIQIKAITLQALAQTVGMQSTGDKLAGIGADIHMAPNALSVVLGADTLAFVKVNTEALPYFIKGQMNTYSAKMVKEKVAELLTEASNSPLLPKGPVAVPDTTSKKAQATAKAASAEVKSASFKEAPVKSGGKVKLAQATHLHQPVFGTSSGSTYHVVAMGDGVNVALRLHLNMDLWKISIRFEGPAVEKHMSRLNQADIGVKDGGAYASQHLTGDGGKVMARRTIGALLMSSGIPFNQVSSDPIALAGKGEAS